MMTISKAALRHTLIHAQSAQEALAGLFQQAKAANKGFSLAYVAKKTGIKSKGHISDLLGGRRRIHPKHRHSLARIFHLDEIEEAHFKLLILADNVDEGEEKQEVLARCAIMRKTLAAETRTMVDARAEDMHQAFEVFAAFGLFGNTPSAAELLNLYQGRKDIAVRHALANLQAWKMIEKDDERYRVSQDQVYYVEGQRNAHLHYLKIAAHEAAEKVEKYFSRSQEALFDARVVSVDRKRYEAILGELRLMIGEYLSRMESSQADGVVKVNLQIFPVDFTP